MKISYLLALLLFGSSLPLQVTATDNVKNFAKGAPADAGVINKERILYWLEKRGELAVQASDKQKSDALAHYLAKKTFQAKTLPLALAKKVNAAERFNSRETRENISLNKELKKTQMARSLLQSMPAAEVETRVKILAILVDFNDLKYDDNGLTAADTSMFYASYPASHYNELLFSTTGFNGPSNQNIESAYQYYQHESGQQFFFTGQVKGWVTTANNASYYGGNDAVTDNDTNVGELVIEAVTQLVADGVDLSDYDKTDLFDFDGDGNVNEPDGIIDHIMIFHASIGEEAGGGNLAEDAIWSHRHFVLNDAGNQPATIPGSTIKAFGYTINPIDAAPGVVVHEFGHDLGLPDEYDIANSDVGSPVSEWSVMASGTWLGFPAGTRPSAFSPYLQERYQGNWINQHEVNFSTLSRESVSLVSTVNHNAVNQIKVNLPPLQFDFPVAYAGEYQFYSNKGDMKENSMSFTVNLPAGTSTLTMKARWDIEQDYDYIQILANDTAITGNHAQSSNQYYSGLGAYISGKSADIAGAEGDLNWVDLSFDLANFAGQNVTIKINYVTDQAEGGYGFVVDEIKITNNSNEIARVDGETENEAILAGFSRLSDKIDGLAHNYYVQLRSHTSVDSYLRNIGYDAGVLLWYRNDNITDNKVDEHAGELFIGVVDADQALVKSINNSIQDSSYQIHDAAFSLYDQQPFNGDDHTLATSLFHDSDDYSSVEQPGSGIILPQYSFSMSIDQQSSDSTTAVVTLSNATTPSDLTTSFSHVVNNLTVSFTAAATGGNNQYSYAWDFGDNSTSSVQSPSHTYAKAGTYSVVLTVTDGSGLVTKATSSIIANTAPVITPPAKVNSSGGGGSMGFSLLFGLCLLRRFKR
jgi:immune inhibitor A